MQLSYFNHAVNCFCDWTVCQFTTTARCLIDFAILLLHQSFKRKHAAKNMRRTWFDSRNGRLAEFSYICKHDIFIVLHNAKTLQNCFWTDLVDLMNPWLQREAWSWFSFVGVNLNQPFLNRDHIYFLRYWGQSTHWKVKKDVFASTLGRLTFLLRLLKFSFLLFLCSFFNLAWGDSKS